MYLRDYYRQISMRDNVYVQAVFRGHDFVFLLMQEHQESANVCLSHNI